MRFFKAYNPSNTGEHMTIETRGDALAKVFRWTARILSTLVITYALFMFVASVGFDDTGPNLGIVIF